MRLFSTEQVSRFHPDKMADSVSDTLLTFILRQDPYARVAIECMLKSGHCFLAGEYTTSSGITDDDLVRVANEKLRELDIEFKTKDYRFTVELSRQSVEINHAVVQENGDIGAGDQGMMFGYATRETESLLPFGFDLANKIIARIEEIVIENNFKILKGDAKCQVTVDLDKKPNMDSVHTVLISVCHQPEYSLETIQEFIKTNVIEKLGIPTNGKVKILINPAGSWTIGGPVADSGLTGRKIVCDQYGGYTPVGGGAISSKDPSKVDRSAVYMARHLATRIIKEIPEINTCEFQLAYAIGVTEPVSVSYKYTIKHGFGKHRGEFNKHIDKIIGEYDLSPKGIINHLKLLLLDYGKIAGGCHFRNHYFSA